MQYKTFFLDCDGVILDSNDIKTQAFRDALDIYPADKVAELIVYHKQNGGVSRFEKFEYFFKNILNEFTQSRYDEALKEFEYAVLDRLKNASFTRGAREFLSSTYRCADLYVISGGAERELIEVFEHKRCAHWFQGIRGSPTTKSAHFEQLLNKQLVEKPVVFIGDSLKDYEVSKEFNVDFIFLTDYSDMDDCADCCKKLGLEHYPDFERLRAAKCL